MPVEPKAEAVLVYPCLDHAAKVKTVKEKAVAVGAGLVFWAKRNKFGPGRKETTIAN